MKFKYDIPGALCFGKHSAKVICDFPIVHLHGVLLGVLQIFFIRLWFPHVSWNPLQTQGNRTERQNFLKTKYRPRCVTVTCRHGDSIGGFNLTMKPKTVKHEAPVLTGQNSQIKAILHKYSWSWTTWIWTVRDPLSVAFFSVVNTAVPHDPPKLDPYRTTGSYKLIFNCVEGPNTQSW